MSLHFQIDPGSGVPVYRQMMDQVKNYLASNALHPGDQLPSIRELAQSLAVNPTTVVKAYSELAHENIVEVRHGKGVFISAQAQLRPLAEKERVVRRLARQLAVESLQLAVRREDVERIMEEEWDALQAERREEEPAAGIRIAAVRK